MLLLLSVAFLQTQVSAGRVGPSAPAAPLATAAVEAKLAAKNPVIDGREDDEVWATAQVIDQFRESRPTEDADPRLRTEARVAYDERNLFVLVRAFDSHPDSIVGRLSRRDDDVTSDWINLYLDSYHDRRTGFRFGVNPVGVKVDGVLYNDGDEDWAWDGVWEVATRIDSAGWTAEFKIPLSQLRYPTRAENTFGLSVRRYISRYTSEVSWPLNRMSRPGTASQLGELTGLRGLASPRRVELTPYMVTKNVVVSDGASRSQRMTGGGDLKYAISSNMTLTATVNPDFGQVEADPSVLNLSAFETFFRERRPFFVEGTGLFRLPVNCFIVVDCNTGEGLFYSRRIGRPPQLTDDYPTTDAPTSTAIIGAAKLTGRTSRGLSVGLLDAVTQHLRGGIANAQTLEPATNYSVVRARQDFRGGESNIGFIGTGVNRALDSWSDQLLRRSAYVGGFDFFHRFPGKRYQLTGQFNASTVTGTPEVIASTQQDQVHYYQRPDGGLTFDPSRTSLSGYSTEVRFAKFGGEHTTFETAVGRRSPGFEPNDLGYLRRADEQNWSTWFAYRWRKPRAFYQSIQWNFNHWQYFTAAGLPTERAFNSNVHMQFNNRWWLHTGGTLGALGNIYCDRCARGGPAVREDMTVSWWGGIQMDNRKPVQPQLWANYWRSDGGRTASINISPSIDFRFSSRIGSEIGVSFTHNRDNTQWYDNQTDALGTHYLFAHLEQKTASITWRLDFTLTPNVTLQVYASPFVSKGTYTNFRELSATPRAKDYNARYQSSTLLAPIITDGFNFKEFRSNVVFRWEYRPGSTLFLVWQQGREDDNEDFEGNRRLGGDLRDLFRLRADNAFLLKASYWLNW
jgi:hypothetical protein